MQAGERDSVGPDESGRIPERRRSAICYRQPRTSGGEFTGTGAETEGRGGPGVIRNQRRRHQHQTQEYAGQPYHRITDTFLRNVSVEPSAYLAMIWQK